MNGGGVNDRMNDLTQFFGECKNRFPDETRCRQYLFKHKWPNGFRCPRCGHTESSYNNTRELYKCRACNYQASLTAGTLFHKTRMPLRAWFWMIMLICRYYDNVNISAFQKTVGIRSYKTAWTMSHIIFKALCSWDAEYLLVGLLKIDSLIPNPYPSQVEKKTNTIK